MSSGLELILNASTGTPVGGVNTARVQNDVGDLCLWSSNFAGMRISAGTGNVAMTGTLNVAGQLTASNVSVLGTTQIINAYETHSSNVVINNYGTGPALAVMQTETTAQPVAAFYAGSNTALMVTSTGQVGIGKSTAGYALDVSGSVNVSGTITTGNTGIRYWTIYGTTSSTVGTQTNYPTPSGMTTTPANIVAIWGVINCSGNIIPIGHNYNSGWVSVMWMNAATICINPVGSTVVNMPFNVTIATLT